MFGLTCATTLTQPLPQPHLNLNPTLQLAVSEMWKYMPELLAAAEGAKASSSFDLKVGDSHSLAPLFAAPRKHARARPSTH